MYNRIYYRGIFIFLIKKEREREALCVITVYYIKNKYLIVIKNKLPRE